jgi:dTDP-4-amino-4,6-dideoxy-D-galactose acyltransferase
MYETWLKKSVSREIADEVYVYMEDFNIYGFVTIKKNNQQATIGLIAVDSQKQKNGIGRKLIHAVEKWAIDQKLHKISVATQQQNIDACNFYKKMGFEIHDEEYIYHIWNKNPLL